MPSNNKVEYGLKNVHYALFDTTTNTYGTPKPWRGAVSLSTEPQGDTSKFFADDVAYYVTDTNSGESGTIEVALATDDVKIDLLGYKRDANGVLYEPTDASKPTFALLFEINGDANKRRGAFYNCTLNRPSETHNTQGETTEVDTNSFDINMIGRDFETSTNVTENVLKSSVDNAGETHKAYDVWFTQVVEPGATLA